MANVAALKKMLDEGIALTRGTKFTKRSAWDQGRKLIAEALEGAGFRKHVPTQADGSIVAFTDRIILRAADLDATQRAIAEHASREPMLYLSEHPLPSTGWARRQWLGMEKAGPLFKETRGVTLFEAIRLAMQKGEDEGKALLAKLPPRERFEVAADFQLMTADCWVGAFAEVLSGSVAQIDKRYATWAATFAPRLLALHHLEKFDRESPSIAPLYRPTFLALVRCGKLEERFDVLLPLDARIDDATVKECLAAIPEVRRGAALAAGLRNVTFTNDAVILASSLLTKHPHPEVAEYILQNLGMALRPKDALATVKTTAKKSPAIAKVLEKHEEGKAPVPELRAASRKKGAPKLSELDAIAQKQLVESSKRYNGKKTTAKAILEAGEGDEQIWPPTIERIRIVDDKGKHAYDVWLYNGDSGTVFRAGTVKVVAERIQAGLDSEDDQLRIGLLAALAGEKKAGKAGSKKKK